jgi:hypothetical protein
MLSELWLLLVPSSKTWGYSIKCIYVSSAREIKNGIEREGER